MHRLSLTLAVAMAAIALPNLASAQTQPYQPAGPQQDWTVDLGVGVLFSQDSGGDTGQETRAVPYIAANWRDRVYFSPFEGLGWNVVSTPTFRAGVQLRPRFEADEIEGLDLDRPNFGADAAAYAYQRLSGNIVVGARVSRDISDVSEGTEYQASVGHQRTTPVGLLNTSLYVRGGDRRLADAYYGVSASEAAANAIEAYSPDGGLQGAGATALLIVPFSGSWAAGGLVNYERRLGDIADSPLSRSDDAWRLGAFVARRFGA
jgi:outer membrane protein